MGGDPAGSGQLIMSRGTLGGNIRPLKPLEGRAAASRSAEHTRSHSPRTFSRRQRLNLPYLIVSLIQPMAPRRSTCVNGHRRCCGPDYVADGPHRPAAREKLAVSGNIISFTQSAARKAISPVFALQGRSGPGSAASQSARALAFISMSISA